MQQALQSAGYQAVVATDGYQALTMLPLEQPQCLILDIVLPGMSGFEVCRQIRSKDVWKNVPIIIVSTKNSSSDRFWAMRQGANQYLPKPFKGEQLVQAVTGVLSEGSSSFPQRTTGPQHATSVPSGTGVGVGARTGAGHLYAQDRVTADARMQSVTPLAKLIPRLYEHPDSVTKNNPDAMATWDWRVRQVYVAIDGQRNVETIAAMTRMSRDDTVRVLRFLIGLQRIYLWDPAGRIIESL